jgi:hypothetical protein
MIKLPISIHRRRGFIFLQKKAFSFFSFHSFCVSFMNIKDTRYGDSHKSINLPIDSFDYTDATRGSISEAGYEEA